MGEYIKHPITGEEIKIGVLNHCFYSREQLLKFKADGFKGYYGDNFNDDLDNMLNNKNGGETLYKLPESCGFDVDCHTVKVKNGLEHSTVYLWSKGNRGNGYQYQLPCKQEDESEIYAVLIGEKFNREGSVRSIFQCDCCKALFSLTVGEADKLKAEHPYWADHIHGNGSAK